MNITHGFRLLTSNFHALYSNTLARLIVLTTPVEQGSDPHGNVSQMEFHVKTKSHWLRSLSSSETGLPGPDPSLKMDESNYLLSNQTNKFCYVGPAEREY